MFRWEIFGCENRQGTLNIDKQEASRRIQYENIQDRRLSRLKRFRVPSSTYQSSILSLSDNVGLMDKDILCGWRIVAAWSDEAKALSVGKPLDSSFDFVSHDD